MSRTFEFNSRPRKRWQAIDFKQIILDREQSGFRVSRDITIRYRQIELGRLGATLPPRNAMLIFWFIFHRLAPGQSDGTPYKLFAYAGVAPRTPFSTSVSQSSNSPLAKDRTQGLAAMSQGGRKWQLGRSSQ